MLGATPGGILGMTTRRSITWLLAGLAGGLLAVLVARVVPSMLFGLAPIDSLALAAAVLALGWPTHASCCPSPSDPALDHTR